MEIDEAGSCCRIPKLLLISIGLLLSFRLQVEPVPFNKFADASKLRSYLRLTSFDVLSRLVEKLGEELARLRREAEDSSTSRSDRARGVDW